MCHQISPQRILSSARRVLANHQLLTLTVLAFLSLSSMGQVCRCRWPLPGQSALRWWILFSGESPTRQPASARSWLCQSTRYSNPWVFGWWLCRKTVMAFPKEAVGHSSLQIPWTRDSHAISANKRTRNVKRSTDWPENVPLSFPCISTCTCWHIEGSKCKVVPIERAIF